MNSVFQSPGMAMPGLFSWRNINLHIRINQRNNPHNHARPQRDLQNPDAVGDLLIAPLRKPASIKEEIEESGLFGGISNRLKKSADVYLNQKLDEIENRIDRKLDEIDRRLAEWRDKEIANRIKILKITLWASVIVGVVSLIYTYVTEYVVKH